MTLGLKIYLLCLSMFLGASLASFLTCLSDRRAAGESILRGRSHCDACGHTLGFLDLVPIFSFLFLRGKCRHCGKRLSSHYFASELTLAGIFLLTPLAWGFSLATAEALFFATVLFYIALRDLHELLVPDVALLVLLLGRIGFILFADDIPQTFLFSGIGAVAVSVPILLLILLLDRILKKESMGGGDIKLFFATGAYLGWKRALFAVLLSCLFGLLFAIISLKNGDSDRETSDGDPHPSRQIPFAPAIALGSYVALLFGDAVMTWYLNLFI